MGTPTPGSQCLLKTKAGAAEGKTPQAHTINYISKKQQHRGGSRAGEGTPLYNAGKQGLLEPEMEHKVRVAHDGGVWSLWFTEGNPNNNKTQTQLNS